MSDTRAAIDTGNQNFMATFGQQDAAGMARLFTANDQLLPAWVARLRARSAI